MDYDVAAVGLSVPPAAASLTTYRPAISVKNNGRYDAIARGTLSAYKAGLRVWSSPVSSNAIEPGETGIATAQDDWTPDTEGTYVFFGYVSCDRDQVEPNNNLAPVTVTVGTEPPPPPPPVAAHASQHEHGGSDVLDVDDLPGQLRDEQRPESHASTHQAGGNDQLNVAGLAGILADAQTPIDHGNAQHTENFTTQDELDNHANAAAAHTAATNLANRETSGPEAGIVKGEQLALGSEVVGNPPELLFLANDRWWRHTPSSSQSSLGINAEPTQASGPVGVELVSMPVPIAWINQSMQFILRLKGYLHSLAATGANLHLTVLLGEEELAELDIPAEALEDLDYTITADITGGSGDVARAALSFLASNGLDPTDVRLQQSEGSTLNVLPTEDTSISVRAIFTNAHPETFLQQTSGIVRALHQPSS